MNCFANWSRYAQKISMISRFSFWSSFLISLAMETIAKAMVINKLKPIMRSCRDDIPSTDMIIISPTGKASLSPGMMTVRNVRRVRVRRSMWGGFAGAILIEIIILLIQKWSMFIIQVYSVFTSRIIGTS